MVETLLQVYIDNTSSLKMLIRKRKYQIIYSNRVKISFKFRLMQMYHFKGIIVCILGGGLFIFEVTRHKLLQWTQKWKVTQRVRLAKFNFRKGSDIEWGHMYKVVNFNVMSYSLTNSCVVACTCLSETYYLYWYWHFAMRFDIDAHFCWLMTIE